MTDRKHTTRTVVTNDAAHEIDVGLEPWGMYLPLEPNASFEIVAESPREGDLEVVREATRVVVYAWPGATLRVYRGGALVHEEIVAFPDIPAGRSVRAFMAGVGLDRIVPPRRR